MARNAVDVAAHVLEHHVGHPGREHHLEAGVEEVPAHHVFGARVEDRLAWPPRAGLRLSASPPRSTTAAAPSPKSPAATKLATDEVVALHGEAAQLDREQHGGLLGEAAQQVAQTRRARHAGHAAQAEDRQPLHVGPQPQLVDQPRVDAGRGQAGDAGEAEHVDVARAAAPPSPPPRAPPARPAAPPRGSTLRCASRRCRAPGSRPWGWPGAARGPAPKRAAHQPGWR